MSTNNGKTTAPAKNNSGPAQPKATKPKAVTPDKKLPAGKLPKPTVQPTIAPKPAKLPRSPLPPGRPVARIRPQPQIRSRDSGVLRSPAQRGLRTSASDQIRARLTNASPWYQSISRPLSHGGSKIPDAFGTATATNQMVFDTSVSINAQGVAGLRVVCPYPNSQPVAGGALGYNYQITNSATTAANIDWGDGTTYAEALAFPSNSTFVGFAQGVRIVSGEVMAMPEMSTLSDQGEMCAFVTPFGRNNVVPLPYSLIESLYDSTPVALNKHKSLRASWYPASMIDGQGYSRDYRDMISPAINNLTSDEDAFPYWEFGVIVAGAAASSGTVRYRIVINYEWVPQYNAVDVVSPGPSPVDIEEEDFVLAEMQSNFPVTAIIPDKALSAAPTVAPVQSGQQNDTGFGFFAEILREVGPMVLKAVMA